MTARNGFGWTKLRFVEVLKDRLPQGYRKAHRVEVVERDLFATPNSLKSHEGQKVLYPTFAILVP